MRTGIAGVLADLAPSIGSALWCAMLALIVTGLVGVFLIAYFDAEPVSLMVQMAVSAVTVGRFFWAWTTNYR